MPNSQSETNELKDLQREVAELRAQRKGRRSKAESAAEETVETVEAPNGTEPLTQDSIGKKQAPDWDETLQDLATHLERVAKEIEAGTRERPALGLLAAFSTGIVVGYLLPRRYQ